MSGRSKWSRIVPWKSSASRFRRWALPENLRSPDAVASARSVWPRTWTPSPSSVAIARRGRSITQWFVPVMVAVGPAGSIRKASP